MSDEAKKVLRNVGVPNPTEKQVKKIDELIKEKGNIVKRQQERKDRQQRQ